VWRVKRGIPDSCSKKNGNPEGRTLMILEFRGHGVEHFGISKGKGGGMFMLPVVGYGYFS